MQALSVWSVSETMTVEAVILYVLIALWLVPPIIIVVKMRPEWFEDGLSFISRLPMSVLLAISRHTQRHVVEPLKLTFDEETKAHQREMIERDTIKIEIMELRAEMDFAMLKALEYRRRIYDLSRDKPRKKLTKKEIRFAEKQKLKSRREKKLQKQIEVPSEQAQPDEQVAHSLTPSSSLELHEALTREEHKIQELSNKISVLRSKIDQFDTATTLKVAQESHKVHEELLHKLGCDEQLAEINAMEIALNEKIARMHALATAQREVRLELRPPPPEFGSEDFRKLVEIEKEKILVKQAKLPTREEIKKIEEFGVKINRFFNFHRIFHRKINDFVARVDPDSDRAFERMRDHFRHATRAHELSKQNASDLQTTLTLMSVKISELSEKIAENNSYNVMNLTSTRTSLEASVIDLEATLNSLRRKNIANEHRLFDVALVIDRLQVIRVMLSVLPVSLRDSFDALIQIVNGGCALLINDSIESGVIEHIEDRLSKLEHNTMMVFIKIAKGEKQDLKGREITQFKERLQMASAALVIERKELQSHKESWDAALNSSEENMTELRTTATYRSYRYATLLKMIEQSIDLISILSLGKQICNQSSE